MQTFCKRILPVLDEKVEKIVNEIVLMGLEPTIFSLGGRRLIH